MKISIVNLHPIHISFCSFYLWSDTKEWKPSLKWKNSAYVLQKVRIVSHGGVLARFSERILKPSLITAILVSSPFKIILTNVFSSQITKTVEIPQLSLKETIKLGWCSQVWFAASIIMFYLVSVPDLGITATWWCPWENTVERVQGWIQVGNPIQH